jgi:TRAP-type C4-dicarboxylate transport system substrate-binding protein
MFRHSVLTLALVSLVASGAAAQTTTIKLATVAPSISAYNKALTDLGTEWEAKTSGRVKLIVYANGSQGSEDATLRMMRPAVDQLQGNLLTLPGLSSIDDAFSVFGVPFLRPLRKRTTCWKNSARCSRSGSRPKASSCSPGAAPDGCSCFRRTRSPA